MAVASIAVPPDPARDARARALVDLVATWPVFTLNKPHGSFPIGSQFRQATGSKGEKYLVNSVVCECCDYTNGHVCKHIRAVVLFEAEAMQFKAEVDAALGAPQKPRPSYADLFPACKTAGCGDLADSRDGYCDRCAGDREWQARRAV